MTSSSEHPDATPPASYPQQLPPPYGQAAYQPPHQPPYGQPAYDQAAYGYPQQPPPAAYGPGYGAPPNWGVPPVAPERPQELHLIVGLLVANLVLSVLLTIVTVFTRHSIIDYQLDHRNITDPQLRETLRDSYQSAIIGRVVGNVIVSVVYGYLVRALLRGRRWAYRRVIWIGSVGVVALLLAQATPYPAWMRVEQLVQAAVLAGLVFVVTRPAVRAYFAKGLPGRDVRRFRRG